MPQRASFRPVLQSIAVRPGWHGSRTKLRRRDVPAFSDAQPELFTQVATAVCSAEVLPRKELFECWEVACHVDARFPNAVRVADLAAGHGLLGWMLVLLAASDSRPRSAVCVDVRMPASADTLSASVLERWPELHGSLDYVEGGLEKVQADPGVLITSVHACGPLTDAVLERAVAGSAAIAVMPCCHSLRKQPVPPVPGLTKELLAERAAATSAVDAIDGARVEALRAAGYEVEEHAIDPNVTPYNRLLLAQPIAAAAEAGGAAGGHGGCLEALPRRGGLRRQLRSIPLCDLEAIRAIAGRRPFESVRSMEVSLWLPDGHPLDREAIALIARRASAAAWRPRGKGATSSLDDAAPAEADGSGAQPSVEGCDSAPQYWDVEAAVAAARASASSSSASTSSFTSEGVAEAGEPLRTSLRGGHPPKTPSEAVGVQVVLRETYHEEGSSRRACAFAIDFMSHERELTRGEVGMWQARVREALECWAEQDALQRGDASDGGGASPSFELR